MQREKWWIVFSRHITTITVILGALWWLATPRVEGFIRETVEDRIVGIERRLDQQQTTLLDILQRLDKLNGNSNGNKMR